MNVKGILTERLDGKEYLVGFGHQDTGRLVGPPLEQADAGHAHQRVPIDVGPDGRFHGELWLPESECAGTLVAALDDPAGNRTTRKLQLGPREPQLIGPGWRQDLFLWGTFAAALKALPAPPAWPTWRPSQ